MKAPNQFRARTGMLATTDANGPNGMFMCHSLKFKGVVLRVVASDASHPNFAAMNIPRWEHASVSTPTRCPTWEEMCWIKSLFWEPEEAVMQLHPPESEWISNHKYCLHLWRPLDVEIPRPPSMMVGVKAAGEIYG